MKDRREESFARLHHIIKSIEEIEKFTRGYSEKEFIENAVLSSAVLFHFTLIGEAVIHVEQKILNKYNYPWHQVRAFRNLIAHEYFNIKLSAVWQTITTDIQKFKSTVQAILESEF